MVAEAPLYFSPPLIEILNPPFQNFVTPIHPIALERWFMASLVIRFFSSLLLSNQRTNFCNFVTKVNKIAETVGFPGTFVYKALRTLFLNFRPLIFSLS